MAPGSRPEMRERQHPWQKLRVKMNDFDHLVYFWNPKSSCIDQRYEIQFWVLLSSCYSGYPVKHLLIEPQKHIEAYSRASW
jgi:hypothetical protein